MTKLDKIFIFMFGLWEMIDLGLDIYAGLNQEFARESFPYVFLSASLLPHITMLIYHIRVIPHYKLKHFNTDSYDILKDIPID